MSGQRLSRLPAALLAAATSAALASSAGATVLTFNMTYLNFDNHSGVYSYFKTVSGASGPQTQYHAYGDNVNASTLFPVPGDPEPSPFYRYNYEMGNDWTPNVTTSYAIGAGASDILSYEGTNWPRVAYLNGLPGNNLTDRKFYFTFTPDAGYEVAVNSFRFYSFAYDTYGMNHDVAWSIYSNASITTDANGVVTAFGGTLQDSGTTGTFGAGTGTINTAQQFYTGPVTLVLHHTSGDSGFLGIDDISFDQQLVPEPASLGLAGVGVAVLTCRGRRRAR